MAIDDYIEKTDAGLYKFVGYADILASLPVSESTIRRAMDAGELPDAGKVGVRRVWLASVVNAWYVKRIAACQIEYLEELGEAKDQPGTQAGTQNDDDLEAYLTDLQERFSHLGKDDAKTIIDWVFPGARKGAANCEGDALEYAAYILTRADFKRRKREG